MLHIQEVHSERSTENTLEWMVWIPTTLSGSKSQSCRFWAVSYSSLTVPVGNRDYTLNGSYRAILHLPKELSWDILRYTDPEVALAQADEDKLLGFDSPAVVEDGKFMALQINIALGTASYATMALREITKTETSSHFQTSLTNAAEDQKYRGHDGGVAEGEEVSEEIEVGVDEGGEVPEEIEVGVDE